MMMEYPPLLTGTTQEQIAALREYLVRRIREQEAAAEGGQNGGLPAEILRETELRLQALSGRIDRTTGTIRREYADGQEQTGAWLRALLAEPEKPAEPEIAQPSRMQPAALSEPQGQDETGGLLSAETGLRLGEHWLLSDEDGLGLRCLNA